MIGEASSPGWVWLPMYAWDLGRYLIVAGAAFGFFWVWKRDRFSSWRIQPKAPKPAKLREEVRHSMVTALIFSFVGVGVYYGTQAGVLRIYPNVSDYGIGYLILSVALLILLQDTYFYWTHRLMHHRWFFRWSHAVHHRSVSPSPWTAYSFAPAEALVHAAFVPLTALVLPVHQVALFLFLSFMIVRNVQGHLGIELLPRGFTRHWLGRWSTTAVHHDLHHRNARKNFGLYFTFWDRLLGTTDERYEAEFERVTEKRAGPREPVTDGHAVVG